MDYLAKRIQRGNKIEVDLLKKNSMKFLITQIQDYLLSQEKAPRERTSFWASEVETPVFDLYHKWIGTPPTNPISADRLLIMQTGKLVEESYRYIFERMGILIPPKIPFWKWLKGIRYKQHRIDIEREGIKVSGYLDAIIKEEGKLVPIEIKSFYGYYQEKELLEGKPKISYLKQLAVYLDALKAEKGYLLYIDRGTGKTYQFPLFRNEVAYACNLIKFNIQDVYKRWARLYKFNILPKIEPKSEFRYKYPLEEIDWSKVSKSQLTKALNNQAILGDWQVKYSNWKDLILKQEGSTLGYSDEEIEKIKELYGQNKTR